MIDVVCNVPNPENKAEHFVTIYSTEDPGIIELVTWDRRGTTIRNRVCAKDLNQAAFTIMYGREEFE